MQIGDTVNVPSEFYDDGLMRKIKGLRSGHVVYIHPAHRYFLVQYANGTRESFLFQHRTSDQMLDRENRSRKY
ncbi:MAG: hypothetical protein VB023_09680 [Oscillibacter sp.]|nr:hypothetical protein [Oscillibacter sp.]